MPFIQNVGYSLHRRVDSFLWLNWHRTGQLSRRQVTLGFGTGLKPFAAEATLDGLLPNLFLTERTDFECAFVHR
jgi:hypothetical protein